MIVSLDKELLEGDPFGQQLTEKTEVGLHENFLKVVVSSI